MNAADARPEMLPAAPTTLRERNYILVLANQFLSYVSNQTIIPVIPLYLVAQGHGESFIGLVIAAFNITSFSARPIFGSWVDRGHPRAALSVSCLLLSVASWAYLIPNMLMLFIVRAIHGLGWAGVNTAGSAWVAHLAPANRRAEAVGYFTVTQSSGIAFAPVLGIWLFNTYGPSPAFAVAGFVALVSVIVILQANERRVPREHSIEITSSSLGENTKPSLFNRMIEPSALLSTSLLAAMQFNVPVFSSYVPLYFLALGIPHVELFFLATGLFSMVGRGTLGRFADRVGRLRSIALGAIIQLIGLILMGQGSEIIGLTLGGIILTLGQSVSHPSLYALVIDRSPPQRRGAALATYTMGFQLGSGVGAVVFGFVIQYLGYHVMYQLSLIPVAAALIATLLVWRRQSRAEPSSGAAG
ncbi:MAG TPA: MFS transporter [Chloroflexota bacterium]|jgi:MFS family permease|nr:MFS transporter [Chloroflexota bacterium]